MAIHFFNEDVKVSLKHKRVVKQWLHDTATKHGYLIDDLNYIFCSDPYLFDINQTYLHHDTFTDIITFDQSEVLQQIEGDIYISTDRVRENAQNLETSFNEELFRVIIHGLLHLCGFKDKSKGQKSDMRKQEDLALQMLYEKLNTSVPRGTVK